MNKESILKQIQEAEKQISCLRDLIVLDEGNALTTEEDIQKGLDSADNGMVALSNIYNELFKEKRRKILIELTKESQEMGLYDDTSNPMIKEPADETEHLLSTEANKKRLYESIQGYKESKQLVPFLTIPPVIVLM
jgi:hypothetical protein